MDVKLIVSPKKADSNQSTKHRETGESSKSETRRGIVSYTDFDKETRTSEFIEVSWNKIKEVK